MHNRIVSTLIALVALSAVARADVFVFDDTTGTPTVSQSPDVMSGPLYDTVAVNSTGTCFANGCSAVTISPTDGLTPDFLVGSVQLGDPGTNLVNYQAWFNGGITGPKDEFGRSVCTLTAETGSGAGGPPYVPFLGSNARAQDASGNFIHVNISSWPKYTGPYLGESAQHPPVLPPVYIVGLYHEPFTCPSSVCPSITTETSGVQVFVWTINWRNSGGTIVRSDTWYVKPQ